VSNFYDEEFYRVEKVLASDISERNPTFLVYGDNQGCFRLIEDFGKKHNWWTWKQALIPFYQAYWLSTGVLGAVNAVRYSADGGKGTRLMMRDVMYREAVASEADFILNVGDICAHDGRYPSHWRRFLIENKTQSPLLNEIAYLPTAGNHERTSDIYYGKPNFEAVFDYPTFYSIEFKDAELFVIDSELICDLYGDIEDEEQDRLFEKWYVSSDPEQPAWLERKLKNSDKPFKMISMHIPLISFGRHFDDWTGEGDYGRNIPVKRHQLLELLRLNNVQLVFAGHEHIYQHNVLHFVEDDERPSQDLHLVVSSGGGVPLRYLPDEQTMARQQQYFQEHDYDVENVMMKRVFHYCEVAVTATTLSIQTYEVDPKADEQIKLIETILIPAN
jgi:hypothetical protein